MTLHIKRAVISVNATEVVKERVVQKFKRDQMARDPHGCPDGES
jgi:hypothetical protein